jgi:hypothetical protein
MKAASGQVKKVTLRLIETFVDKCDDTAMITTQFVPAMMDPVLGDYARNVPDARCAQRFVFALWGCCSMRWRARRAAGEHARPAAEVRMPRGASLARRALVVPRSSCGAGWCPDRDARSGAARAVWVRARREVC